MNATASRSSPPPLPSQRPGASLSPFAPRIVPRPPARLEIVTSALKPRAASAPDMDDVPTKPHDLDSLVPEVAKAHHPLAVPSPASVETLVAAPIVLPEAALESAPRQDEPQAASEVERHQERSSIRPRVRLGPLGVRSSICLAWVAAAGFMASFLAVSLARFVVNQAKRLVDASRTFLGRGWAESRTRAGLGQ